MEGIVFNIQRCSLNDGPGIRTVVFLKGCPLRCIWCHNPESYRKTPQVMFDARKCAYCGRCAAVCTNHSVTDGMHEIRRDACTFCMRCAEVCLSDALEACGKRMTVKEVLAQVKKDRLFYQSSGGGMTLSGGEPLYQPEFALELTRMAKEEGIHVCVETSGAVKWEALDAIRPYVDCFLFDCKETDPERHRLFTGVSNELILENLRRLNAAGAKLVLRCPIIPGCNDREEHFAAVAALAEEMENVERIDIEPYHPLGLSKEIQLGMERRMEPVPTPSDAQVREWMEMLKKHTSKPVGKA